MYMKKFSKIAAVGIFAILAMLVVAPVVLAQQPGEIPGGFVEQADAPTTVGGWVDILITVVQWFYTIVFIIAVLFILLAAWNFITSKGDPEKTKTARSQLLYAVVGIAVALISYVIIYFVENALSTGAQV